MRIDDIPKETLSVFRRGGVIPAQPLALNSERKLDPRRQRALSRYYLDAGSAGIAVGVHTTQFAIRDVGLYEPVLRLAAEEAESWVERTPFMVAGVVGKTDQALSEAKIAKSLGYHAVLLGLAALNDASVDELVTHCQKVADVMPVVGFYLQHAVGGRNLPYAFWKQFAEIENVVGIKLAPFNRYKTLDVVRGVADAGAKDRITLYTGNDDHIVGDLLTPFPVEINGQPDTINIVGGLLGHWSVWTRKAVELVEEISALRGQETIPVTWWTRDAAVTDSNGAFFDAANDYRGVIAGLHEVLRRQGLLEGIWCLDPAEDLGPGQLAEIDRVYKSYPELNDDDFVRQNLDRWLAG
ncbi:dihydrodipicolinate synthase family protein [uncultured Sneathiella sp.]|jgi:dihydrodipicolinate synthase/N-acetylneuraminate lyase|uniref:dihydrodipicolinate synthase family protein n=1 Tax=uncultured Sneathiella sp. TaxID=879315 RepID=UPI0030D91283|tara:strand:+ start:688 stop:1746 length:1059 start_codon:yes stop_codon:yes gene_type:complete